MIITTSGRSRKALTELATGIALEWKSIYVDRKNRSIKQLQTEYNDSVLVVGKDRFELYSGAEPFFFHPNSSMFRIKRFRRGEIDPFITATDITSGSRFFDCTLGLASDSIVASFVVGEQGFVMGCEASEQIAFLVEKGLNKWDTQDHEINEAMRRIVIKKEHALKTLTSLPANEFDVVYIDPMFEETIESSIGIHPLKSLAIYEEMTEEWIKEASRVARDRVVLKDHFRSTRFERFSFDVHVRKSSKFHYGVKKV